MPRVVVPQEGALVKCAGYVIADADLGIGTISPRVAADVPVMRPARPESDGRIRLSGLQRSDIEWTELPGRRLGGWALVRGRWTVRHISVTSMWAATERDFEDSFSKRPFLPGSLQPPPGTPSIISLFTYLVDRQRTWDVWNVALASGPVWDGVVLGTIGTYTPEIVAWLDTLPEGLVELYPWVAPVPPINGR